MLERARRGRRVEAHLVAVGATLPSAAWASAGIACVTALGFPLRAPIVVSVFGLAVYGAWRRARHARPRRVELPARGTVTGSLALGFRAAVENRAAPLCCGAAIALGTRCLGVPLGSVLPAGSGIALGLLASRWALSERAARGACRRRSRAQVLTSSTSARAALVRLQTLCSPSKPMRFAGHWVLFVAVTVSSCATHPPAAAGPSKAASRETERRGEKPPVVVALVIDQLAAWIASERLSALPPEGGFARLLREGTYAREARFAHAVTDTAPGHAALYTGAPPRTSGITSNERLDPSTRGKQSVYRDPSTRVIHAGGEGEETASSAAALRSETVADVLRAQHPDAHIVSLSIKDRGAIAGGGRQPTAVLWYEPGRGELVTSSAFARSLPPWAKTAAAAQAIRSLRREPWALLVPDWVAAHATTPDAQPGEGALPGLTAVFPHDVSQATDPARTFRFTPFADTAILSLSRVVIASDGFGSQPTLLALSLSASDYIGHVYGPDSWEAWDQLRRLDAGLTALFRWLDHRVGVDGWSAVLSSDHGVAPLPETTQRERARPWCAPGARDRWQRPCVTGGRLEGSKLTQELAAEATRVLGEGDWVLGVAEPYVMLTESARGLPARRRDDLTQALRASLERRPEVDRVIETRQLPHECPPLGDETLDALVCRSFLDGAGELYVVTRAGSFFDAEYTPGQGTSHGTPYLYDRAVPILIRAPGRVAAGRIVEGPVSYASFTRALAALLGVPAPEACADGEALVQKP